MKKHKHDFIALTGHFGPYETRDIHYHPCDRIGCDRVLLGPGKQCDGDLASHWRETLTSGVEA